LAVNTANPDTPGRAAKHARGAKKKPRKKRGFVRRWWWAFVAVPVVIGLVMMSTLVFVFIGLQIPDAPPLQQTSILFDKSGHKVITTYHAAVNRKVIPLSQMPQDLQNAVIAIEDHSYYQHGGVDWIGILRAAWADIRSGSVVQGGSTITQQYVKNVYTGSQQTLLRKIKEAMLAIKLQQKYSKNQILAMYLNTIYFGAGAYGVEAAAETYFNEHASQLTTLQSATLAGVINAPSYYDPYTNAAAVKARRNLVLQEMVNYGYLAQSTADALGAKPVKVVQPSYPNYTGAYFAEYTRQYLDSFYPPGTVDNGGLRITSTLDLGLQQDAQNIVNHYLPNTSGPYAALVAIDPQNGQIRAMVGGRNFTKSQFNLAVQAQRQAGSAFKPFTLTSVLKNGWSLNSYWYGPNATTINSPLCGGPWQVANAEPESGYFSLAKATADSVNTVFAQLVTKATTPKAVADMAHRMGIRSPLPPYCSITLGADPVNPLEMTAAYATLADKGVYHSPTPVISVKGPGGKAMSVPKQTTRQAIDPNLAAMVTYALQGVVQYGTGTAASLYPRPVAGKTGTAQNYQDAWFCGYTPQLATCVWMGYPKGEIPMYNIDGFPVVYGGTVPAMIWHDFMSKALAGAPIEPFPTPDFSNNTKTSGVTPPPSPTPVPRHTPTPTPTPTSTLPPSPTPAPKPSPKPGPSPKTTG
jgi:penicillin-binding protein 1A